MDDLPHEKCRQSARKDTRPNRSRSDSDPAADAPHRENADGPLCEPLLTLIESKGGRVIWDDRELNEPLSEVALTTPYLTPDFVLPFRAALAKAAKAIDQDPQKYVPILSKKGLVPPAVANTYKLPKFSGFATPDGLPPLPTDALVQEAADWLVKVGILNQAPDITGTICRL